MLYRHELLTWATTQGLFMALSNIYGGAFSAKIILTA